MLDFHQGTKDQTEHVRLLIVCYKALPRMSRSRQSNESAVDSSCTSLSIHDIYSFEKKTKEAGAMRSRQNHKNPKEPESDLDSAQKHNYGTIVERYFETVQCRMRMHEPRIHAVREFDRIELESKS